MANEEMQAAADTGELARAHVTKITADYNRMLQNVVDRRWMVEQAVKVACVHDMTAKEFADLLEVIEDFIRPHPNGVD